MTKKDRSKFSAWQEAKQAKRETIIDEFLNSLTKSRVKVSLPTYLADLIAKHIAQVEGKPCNKSTLLRNNRYKAKILSYLAKSLAPGAKALNSRSVTDPTAKALITSAQLEGGNLKRESERLKIYVKSLEEQVDRLQSQGRPLPIASITNESCTGSSDFEYRFIRTCQTLRSLIGHLNLIVHIDPCSQRILDASKRRDNVIVGKDVAGPFFDWLAAQGGSK